MAQVGDALLSEDGAYRYELTRRWQGGEGELLWIMLNPSTADGLNDDPTIRRCIAFSKRLGFSGLKVVNLYAQRATDPSELTVEHRRASGGDNMRVVVDALTATLEEGGYAMAAWGSHVDRLRKQHGSVPAADRWADVVGVQLRCLGHTASGAPRHPLYVKADAAVVALGSVPQRKPPVRLRSAGRGGA